MIKSNAGFDLYGLLFLGKILVEPVLSPKCFDILLPEIDLAKSLHIFLDILSILRNLEKIIV